MSLRWRLTVVALLLTAPRVLSSYRVSSQEELPSGWSLKLTLDTPGPYGGDVAVLQCDVSFDAQDRLRVLVRDAQTQRECPELT